MSKGQTLRQWSRAALASSSAIYLFAGAPVAAQDSAETLLDEAESQNAIIVTGSRIARRDESADSPLVTVSNEALVATSEVSLDQGLKELPQFSGGVGQVNGAQDVQSTPTNSPGIATLNLRGIGSNRTLVLLDGRRTQPANATLVVDINTIPKAAIESVEVITGGAGATYGADAVAGVVNFRLKRNFSGITIDTNMGITEHGDGFQTDISALLGSNFADGRGNAMIGLTYQKRNAILQADRPYFQNTYTDPNISGGSSFFGSSYVVTPSTNTTGVPGVIAGFNFSPASGTPSQSAVNDVFAGYGVAPGNVTVSGAGSTASFFINKASDPLAATLFSANPGRISGDPAVNYNGLDPNVKLLANGQAVLAAREGYLSLPLHRISMFANGYYDITDHVTAYLQGKFDNSVISTQSTYAPAFNQLGVGITFDAATCGAASGHPVPQDLCDILASRTQNIGTVASPNVVSRANSPWGLNQAMTFMGPQYVENDTYTYEVLAGLRGDVGVKDWTFDIFAGYGKTSQVTRYDNFVDLDAYQTVIGLPNYGANTTFLQPRTGLTGSCTSGLNPFSTAAVSQDCQDLIQAKIKAETEIEQTQVEANLQGGLVELPAGEMRFAAGAAFRKNTFMYEPSGPLSSATLTSAVISLNGVSPTQGAIDVKEIYGEVLVPVLHDLPFIQQFDLNAGYRLSDYSTAGKVHTWKVTGDWEVNDFLKFRAGYQVANRAPNIAEIFQPGIYTVVNWPGGDPCSRFAAQSSFTGYGNRADNPDRTQLLALCNAVAGTETAGPGGTPLIDANYAGNQPQLFPLGRDVTLGNPGLSSEKGKTLTIGGVLQSPFDALALANMSLSVDYYDIKVIGAVSTVSTDFVYRQCFNFDGQSNATWDADNIYCQRIIRDPNNGFWLATKALFENLGRIATSGVDANFNWSMPAPGLFGDEGAVFTNVSLNWLHKFEVQNQPGGVVIDYHDTIGGPYSSQFKYKLNTTVGYDFGAGAVSLNWRHLPGTRYFTYATSSTSSERPVPSYNIFDLSGRAEILDGVELRLGVENLFDTQPLAINVPAKLLQDGGVAYSGATEPASYDAIGRRFYFGVKAEF